MSQRERWIGKRAADFDDEEQRQAYARGYEPGPDGTMTERDPRCNVARQLEAMGRLRRSAQEALCLNCRDCCAGNPHEVRLRVAVSAVHRLQCSLNWSGWSCLLLLLVGSDRF